MIPILIMSNILYFYHNFKQENSTYQNQKDPPNAVEAKLVAQMLEAKRREQFKWRISHRKLKSTPIMNGHNITVN